MISQKHVTPFHRFVKICSMFEDRNRTTKLVIPSFHGQWYYHGSKSVLHDLAHPRQLFPTDECHDNPLDIIVQKCNVVELGVKGAPEPPEEGKEIKDFFSGCEIYANILTILQSRLMHFHLLGYFGTRHARHSAKYLMKNITKRQMQVSQDQAKAVLPAV